MTNYDVLSTQICLIFKCFFYRFRSNAAALEFYQTYNGAAYNSLEPDSLCHAVWVSEIERGEDGVPPMGHTELPTCPGTIL